MLKYILIAVLALALQISAAEKYRNFTDSKGRTIRGRVVGYNPKKKSVTFQRDNHKTSKVPLSVFSEEDQAYIQDWLAAKNFSSPGRFKISAKRISETSKPSASGIYTKKIKSVHYGFLLENRSDTELKNITIEYCIFYEQEELTPYGQKTNEGIYYQKRNRPFRILPYSKAAAETDTVKVSKTELSGDYYYTSGENNVQNGQVRGIWVKATMTLSSGETVTRDYCVPDGLNKNKNWTTTSVPVGEQR